MNRVKFTSWVRFQFNPCSMLPPSPPLMAMQHSQQLHGLLSSPKPVSRRRLPHSSQRHTSPLSTNTNFHSTWLSAGRLTTVAQCPSLALSKGTNSFQFPNSCWFPVTATVWYGEWLSSSSGLCSSPDRLTDASLSSPGLLPSPSAAAAAAAAVAFLRFPLTVR
ncbi:hypothetical protein INR49_023335 [Caranx melampygus]|nr:hypothetical protein INR49_023335 [Caranx melampygus]